MARDINIMDNSSHGRQIDFGDAYSRTGGRNVPIDENNTEGGHRTRLSGKRDMTAAQQSDSSSRPWSSSDQYRSPVKMPLSYSQDVPYGENHLLRDPLMYNENGLSNNKNDYKPNRSNVSDSPRKATHAHIPLQNEGRNAFQPQQVLESGLVENLVEKLRVVVEESQRLATNETRQVLQDQLMSSIHERGDMGTEQLNIAVSKLDGVMKDFRVFVEVDSERLRKEELRVSKLQVRVDRFNVWPEPFRDGA